MGDIILGIAAGIDTFDCVSPTRQGRNGALYTGKGRINILNAKYTRDMGPVEDGCACYTCTNFTRSYVAHLFRTHEMLGGTLGSIHNLYFLVQLAKRSRQALLDGTFGEMVMHQMSA
jgi:queuine tRNA-ribosyltransferase